MEPSISGSVGEPPWALGKGQGSSQAPWLGRKKRAKGCLSAGEGQRAKYCQNQGTRNLDRVGLGLTCSGAPGGTRGSGVRLRGQGCQGSSYLGRWDPSISSPHGGGSRGWSGAWSKAAEQRSKCSLGASRVLEADRERDSREDEEGEGLEELGEQRSRGGRGSPSSWEKGQGTEAELGGGWSSSPRLVFFNANSVLFAFHLNSRCCYKLSTSSLFLWSL